MSFTGSGIFLSEGGGGGGGGKGGGLDPLDPPHCLLFFCVPIFWGGGKCIRPMDHCPPKLLLLL